MRSDHDTARRRAWIIERTFADTLLAEPLADDRVMNQFTKDGEGLLGSELFGLGDGVADAETETKALGEENFHFGLTL
jgi:hypothetical protein